MSRGVYAVAAVFAASLMHIAEALQEVTIPLSQEPVGCLYYGVKFSPALKSTGDRIASAVDCQQLCRHHPDCAVFGFQEEWGGCWMGNQSAIPEAAPKFVAGPRTCRDPSPACSVVPNSNFPAATSALSHQAWGTSVQPPYLHCWPRGIDGSLANCGEVKVLDTLPKDEWTPACRDLTEVTLPDALTCEQSCRNNATCEAYQEVYIGKNVTLSCMQGLGASCWKNLTNPPGSRIVGGARLLHGSVRTLVSLKGYQLHGLRRIFGPERYETDVQVGKTTDSMADQPNVVKAGQTCQHLCWSSLKCEAWQYSLQTGCWIMDPTFTTLAYPITTATMLKDSAAAKFFVAGELLQRSCGKPLPGVSFEPSSLSDLPPTLPTANPVVVPVIAPLPKLPTMDRSPSTALVTTTVPAQATAPKAPTASGGACFDKDVGYSDALDVAPEPTGASSAQACQAACAASEVCSVFTYIPLREECWLQHSGLNLQTMPGVLSGPKDCSSVPTLTLASMPTTTTTVATTGPKVTITTATLPTTVTASLAGSPMPVPLSDLAPELRKNCFIKTSSGSVYYLNVLAREKSPVVGDYCASCGYSPPCPKPYLVSDLFVGAFIQGGNFHCAMLGLPTTTTTTSPPLTSPMTMLPLTPGGEGLQVVDRFIQAQNGDMYFQDFETKTRHTLRSKDQCSSCVNPPLTCSNPPVVSSAYMSALPLGVDFRCSMLALGPAGVPRITGITFTSTSTTMTTTVKAQRFAALVPKQSAGQATTPTPGSSLPRSGLSLGAVLLCMVPCCVAGLIFAVAQRRRMSRRRGKYDDSEESGEDEEWDGKPLNRNPSPSEMPLMSNPGSFASMGNMSNNGGSFVTPFPGGVVPPPPAMSQLSMGSMPPPPYTQMTAPAYGMGMPMAPPMAPMGMPTMPGPPPLGLEQEYDMVTVTPNGIEVTPLASQPLGPPQPMFGSAIASPTGMAPYGQAPMGPPTGMPALAPGPYGGSGYYS